VADGTAGPELDLSVPATHPRKAIHTVDDNLVAATGYALDRDGVAAEPRKKTMVPSGLAVPAAAGGNRGGCQREDQGDSAVSVENQHWQFKELAADRTGKGYRDSTVAPANSSFGGSHFTLCSHGTTESRFHIPFTRESMKSSLAMIGVTAISIALAACASTSAELQTALAPAASIGTSVECDIGCKREWQRAQYWLGKHATMKVATATDVLIQTYTPPENHPQYGFSVTREPLGGDRYRISAELFCQSFLGCSPKEGDVRNALLYYVKTGEDLVAGKVSGGAIQ
jgi:hypothetical protein